MTELQHIYLVIGVFSLIAIGLPTYALMHALRIKRIIETRAADDRNKAEQARSKIAAKQKNHKTDTDDMSVLEFFS
ncbi:hypothetical protein [Vibrio crassostreae]|uniref:hypothetical protein n=1 Tax=Vibrio crassostreae TaxID=246167 RepID=UPI001B31390D|nr:hypothetical protein [Vibrio crassostreae]